MAIDVSDPTTPRVVGSLQDATVLNGVGSIEVVGLEHAYVAAEGSFVKIDISDPSNMVVLASTEDVRLGAAGLAIDGDVAVVTGKTEVRTLVELDEPR